MDTQQRMEERLWEYIDGVSTPEETAAIEKLMAGDHLWKEKYNELMEIHRLVQSSTLEEPSLRFTKNVMEEIVKYHIAPATKTYINKKIIWGIGIFFITIVVGFLVYGFGQVDWTSKSDSNLPIDLNKVDFSKFFNNTYINIFMMINVLLGLVLLDRYLDSKKKKFQREI